VPPPALAARIWLIRHGQSVWNAGGRWQGQADPGLSELGLAQAERMAERLAALKPANLYSSDLRRCRETAAPLARALGRDVVLRTDLREIDIGAWSGLTRAEIERTYPEEWARWQAGEDFKRGGGESFADLTVRSTTVIRELLAAHEGESIAIVTHGGWIRCVVASALGLAQPLTPTLGGAGNASITTLRVFDGGLRLEAFNDGGHLNGLVS
jgi:broad specificity phosphatase PhoE